MFLRVSRKRFSEEPLRRDSQKSPSQESKRLPEESLSESVNVFQGLTESRRDLLQCRSELLRRNSHTFCQSFSKSVRHSLTETLSPYSQNLSPEPLIIFPRIPLRVSQTECARVCLRLSQCLSEESLRVSLRVCQTLPDTF